MKKIKLFTDSSVNPQEKIGFGAYLLLDDENESFEDFKDNIKIKRFEDTSSTKIELQTLLWALEELKEIVDANYLYYHLNYSQENKNEKVFAKYDNPGAKFGYPVFIVLDQNGKMIHTQDSAVLEEGKGYSKEKVKDFFEKWAPKS